MAARNVYPYVWMLLGSVSFTFMATLAHGLGESCTWQIVALARTGLALLFAVLLALAARVPLVICRPRVLWVRSLAGSISLVCTFFALPRLPVADVLTLTNTFPVWVALLSWPMLGEVPSLAVWLSVACAVTGVALIQQPHLAEGNFATFLALASSFSTAVAMLGLHRLHHLDVRAVVAHFSGVALLFSLGALLLIERDPVPNVRFSSGVLWMLLGVGVTATIGQFFLTKAFAAGPPAKVAVVGLTQVVLALILDFAFWGRSINLLSLLGTVLVLGPAARLIVSAPAEQAGDEVLAEGL